MKLAPGAGSLIVVAYYFPPLVGVASDRAFSMVRDLSGLGWEPLVVTPREGFFHRTAEPPVAVCPVIRTRSLELSRLLRRLYRPTRREAAPAGSDLRVRSVRPRGEATLARRLVHDLLYVPDAQVGWIPFAAAAIEQGIRRASGRPILFSTSVPYSAHLATMAVARRRRLPWVAEFRDPWSSGADCDSPRLGPRRELDRRIEHQIVTRADHVVVVNERMRQSLLEHHDGLRPDRVSVVTNGFVPAPDGTPPGAEEPMTVLFAGTMPPGENLLALMEEFSQLHAVHPGAFRLRVLGPPEPWEQVIRRRGPVPWLALDGVVSPGQARQAMLDSSALLLLETRRAQDGVIPGKAWEYVGARRPILAVVPPSTDLAEFLGAYADVRLVPGHDRTQLRTAMERLLTGHRAGAIQAPRVPPDRTRPLQRAEQARKLSGILEELIPADQLRFG